VWRSPSVGSCHNGYRPPHRLLRDHICSFPSELRCDYSTVPYCKMSSSSSSEYSDQSESEPSAEEENPIPWWSNKREKFPCISTCSMHFPALLCLLSKQSIRQGHRALRVFESLVEAGRGFPRRTWEAKKESDGDGGTGK